MKRRINPHFFWIIGGAIVILVLVFIMPGRTVSVLNSATKIEAEENKKEDKNLNPITGLACENMLERPLAVMLAGDKEARPLAGIGQADLVVEMPVDPRPITRFMAVYQCNPPKEIGSVRSARDDFIPLALGFDALYAHWGGERGALNKLDGGIANNIDAMKYEGTYYYRKSGVPRPHNGFTNADLLIEASKKLGYKMKGGFSLIHSDKKPTKSLGSIAETINLSYLYPVKWQYDAQTEKYKRFRDGVAEIDKSTGQQVSVTTVVVMKTNARWIGDQYITVATQGSGDATFYFNGVVVNGGWSKNPSSVSSPLEFTNSEGKPFEFPPGNIWIQIQAPIS